MDFGQSAALHAMDLSQKLKGKVIAYSVQDEDERQENTAALDSFIEI